MTLELALPDGSTRSVEVHRVFNAGYAGRAQEEVAAHVAELAELALWPALFNGGAGMEWYFGYHDLPPGGDVRTEDFRTREEMWELQWYAHQFFNELPLTDMEPDDSLVSTGECLAGPGVAYGILVDSESSLDLSEESGRWIVRWFDTSSGTWLSEDSVTAGDMVTLTPPDSGLLAAILSPE